MRVLITGARGFVGRNLTENLKNIRCRKTCNVRKMPENEKSRKKP